MIFDQIDQKFILPSLLKVFDLKTFQEYKQFISFGENNKNEKLNTSLKLIAAADYD